MVRKTAKKVKPSSCLELFTASEQETKAVARLLGEELLASLPKLGKAGAVVLALYGELGAGKTTFIKGLAQGLKIKQNLTSPTFIIIACYQFPVPQHQPGQFYHVDPYRLPVGQAAQELRKLGLKEILAQDLTVVAVEWADQVEEILPAERINVTLEHAGENKRRLTLG